MDPNADYLIHDHTKDSVYSANKVTNNGFLEHFEKRIEEMNNDFEQDLNEERARHDRYDQALNEERIRYSRALDLQEEKYKKRIEQLKADLITEANNLNCLTKM